MGIRVVIRGVVRREVVQKGGTQALSSNCLQATLPVFTVVLSRIIMGKKQTTMVSYNPSNISSRVIGGIMTREQTLSADNARSQPITPVR